MLIHAPKATTLRRHMSILKRRRIRDGGQHEAFEQHQLSRLHYHEKMHKETSFKNMGAALSISTRTSEVQIRIATVTAPMVRLSEMWTLAFPTGPTRSSLSLSFFTAKRPLALHVETVRKIKTFGHECPQTLLRILYRAHSKRISLKHDKSACWLTSMSNRLNKEELTYSIAETGRFYNV
ncbi:hypothetical protein DPMN_019953 [Dreissena polymorpha]|uniref:Uncharacterized protein n=1 Tax=Dreissena polymorpha TaxID=45954 RepID=A0A9D4SAM5_DREPO|nr:hypothetical protein DPMN_019953 [Dreissena polymorpha]